MPISRSHLKRTILATTIPMAVACTTIEAPPPVDPAAQAAIVTDVADRYYADVVKRTPERIYFTGQKLERHDSMSDNSPEALRQAERAADEMLERLKAVDTEALFGRPEWALHGRLFETLEASQGLRVCRSELWNVNHMGDWRATFARVAKLQPVGSPELRAQSLARWSKLPAYVDQEIANLKEGLAGGYSAPKSVVARVIQQTDGLIDLPTEKSPFYSPAERDGDEAFKTATRALVEGEITPALKRFRAFLADEYAPAAREALSVLANTDGGACYEASLRSYTTLKRPGKDVFELGKRTVAANKARAVALGEEAYGVSDFAEIIKRAKADPADRFKDKDDLLSFSRDAVARAEAIMPQWVAVMPKTPVEVVPFPEHEEGTGRSAHYLPGGDGRPGEYRIPLYKPEEQSRGRAEITAFHETWPGHHLQISAVQEKSAEEHPAASLIFFSGPVEGWGRYSEALAEEMGLYETTSGPILRRSWPARGMVIDPGLHLFGWTREEATAYARESGSFSETVVNDLVDRVAMLPGQLTAYDSGGLEVFALRREAEEALGDDFDIRAFHDAVLEQSLSPLSLLRAHIEAWIETEQKKR